MATLARIRHLLGDHEAEVLLRIGEAAFREVLGFRPSKLADEQRLTEWTATEVCPVELVEDRQRETLLVQCRVERIEPPGRTCFEKVLVVARNRWERAFCARTIERLGEVCVSRMLALVAEGNDDGTALLASLKRDPGAVGLDSLLTEITKLNDVRRIGLPEGLFAARLLPSSAFASRRPTGGGCRASTPGRRVRVPQAADPGDFSRISKPFDAPDRIHRTARGWR
ncbi:hypothetical protein [Streptomyces sp. NPDC056921]|uniref:hypothetical protein n=1 Tax=Streptomyces sp. NPDC056921 TaxID=3345966 RepID=UPI00363B7B2D